MQCLNDHLASYLERVRSLEADNQRLEGKIQEHLEKKGPQVRDWGHYFKTIEDLRAQVRGRGGNSPAPSPVCPPCSTSSSPSPKDRNFNRVGHIDSLPYFLSPPRLLSIVQGGL